VIDIIIYLFVRIFYHYNIKKYKKYFIYYKIKISYENKRKNTLLYSKKTSYTHNKTEYSLIAKNVVDIDRSIDKSLLRLLNKVIFVSGCESNYNLIVRIDRKGNKFFK